MSERGRALIYCDEDIDPYQSVLEWWNSNGDRHKVPPEHLLEKLGLDKSSVNGTCSCGKGAMTAPCEDPEHFVPKSGNDQRYFDTTSAAYRKTVKKEIELKNSFLFERGPYTIVAVPNESVSDASIELSGLYIDLFDKDLLALTRKVIRPDEQGYPCNIDRAPGETKAEILCGASRTYDEKIGKRSYSFAVKSPLRMTNVSRVPLPKQLRRVYVSGKEGSEPGRLWGERSGILLLRLESGPAGVRIDIE